jgi:hypothetical protein
MDQNFWMIKGIRMHIRPVRDAVQANAPNARLLGVEPYTDAADDVSFRIGAFETGLDLNCHKQGMTGPAGCWEVNDINTSLQLSQESGAQIQHNTKSKILVGEN